jgi:hypothetical protein
VSLRSRVERLLRSPVSPLTRAGRARRRFNCADQGAASWDERARDAVRLWRQTRGTWVPEARAELVVGDLGAGGERLRPALADGMPQPHRYLAYDLHPQLPSTERLDVLSEMPDRRFDVVFCLGLLEYVPPGNSFPARLASTCRFAVVSYVATDLEPLTAEERGERGWVSHYSREQLEALFEAEGFVRDAFTTTERGRSGVWLWSAPREPRATSSGAAPR